MIAELLALSPSNNTLLIALLIPILGVVSPLLLARQINKNSMAVKKQDWDRQDEVAARAEAVAKAAAEAARVVAAEAAQAARLVVARQDALDVKTDEVARLLAVTKDETATQLEKIHGLVNSQMTNAIRQELDATKDTLAMMSELIANHKKAGLEPTVEVLAAFRGREAKIKELTANLKSREKADAESMKKEPQEPQHVIVVNPDPVPVVDTHNPEPLPVVNTPGESVRGGRRADDSDSINRESGSS